MVTKKTSKMSKICSILLLAVIILSFVCKAVSSIPKTVTVAEAWDGSTYSGNEDAEDPSDFNDNMTDMGRFKMWSVFKGMGMNDTQACAALACSQAEGHFRSVIIETNDPLGLGELGTSYADEQKYISNYSDPCCEANFRTQCTDKCLAIYLSKGKYACHYPDSSTVIAQAKQENDVSANGLSETAYYVNGVGYLGVGLFGFTGESFVGLFQWSDTTGEKWYIMENQIAYFIADESIGGYKGAELQQWIEETKSSSLDDCVETFFHTFINGNKLPDLVAARQEIAVDIYAMLAGTGYDKTYAKKVLAMADLKFVGEDDHEIKDRGIIYSYASTVMLYPRNDGFIIDVTRNDSIPQKNSEVWKGYIDEMNGGTDTSTTYSLFELYGEDVHWYRYFGEATYTPTLLDHVWSAIDQHKTKALISFDTIDYDAYNYLSCNVYPDRPTVLSKDDLANGDKDPRVLALSYGWFNGYFYVEGSIKMTIAKYLVSIVSFLLGPEIINAAIDIVENLEKTATWNVISNILMVLVGLIMVFFLFSLVGKSVKYAKGRGAARDVIARFLAGFFCLGFLFAALANPAVFNNVIKKTANGIDTLFTSTLAKSHSNDDVISVTDDSLIYHAMIWRRAIFNPWCRGQFDNRNYDELYTQYAAVDSSKMMPQSHEEIDTTDMTGKAFYDSATLTGDVFVPRGGGVEVRNWAAYLYSCGTKYHIDSTLDEEKASKIDTTSAITFPNDATMTTAPDADIPADTFRIVDAQMDISPQYFATGRSSENYTKAHALKPHYSMQSTVMLFNASLLLFMVPVIFQKIMSFIMLLITSFKMIFFTIMELFKEQTGIKPFFDSVKKSFFGYFTASLKLCIMITLYDLFVDQGFLKLVLYILCCLIILGFNLKDARQFASDVSFKARQIKNKL